MYVSSCVLRESSKWRRVGRLRDSQTRLHLLTKLSDFRKQSIKSQLFCIQDWFDSLNPYFVIIIEVFPLKSPSTLSLQRVSLDRTSVLFKSRGLKSRD